MQETIFNHRISLRSHHLPQNWLCVKPQGHWKINREISPASKSQGVLTSWRRAGGAQGCGQLSKDKFVPKGKKKSTIPAEGAGGEGYQQVAPWARLASWLCSRFQRWKPHGTVRARLCKHVPDGREAALTPQANRMAGKIWDCKISPFPYVFTRDPNPCLYSVLRLHCKATGLLLLSRFSRVRLCATP